MWWRDAVIYQVYPRSFQDSNGDGIGDLPGIVSRLDHVRRLGADAIWLSPFYPSPNADYGYDVSDYEDVDPAYGTLADFDLLVREAHGKGLKVLVDFVPCHTSIRHRWFRERPGFYVWADAPANNWQASFGGTAWQRDPETGRYYLHSFFPEQADLNWRNPAVRSAMTGALEFWLGHGVDGFRLDAIDRLLKDPELRDDPPATEPLALPLTGEYAKLDHVHSGNAPDVGLALGAIREATAGAFLVGEVFLPTAKLEPYLENLDIAFAFEAMHAPPEPRLLRTAIEGALAAHKLGWVISNHDFARFASRFGQSARALAVLFLCLPGPVFLFQGDELGMPDGPGADPPLDRHGRDAFRHPMPWDASDQAGFTTGTPWLPVVDPPERNVADQEGDSGSTLELFRRLIGLRHELAGEARFRDAPAHALALDRGEHTVVVNLGEDPVELPGRGSVVVEARPGDGADPHVLPAHGAVVLRT